MPLELRVPAVGESIAEVQLGEWLKQEGQSFRKDETLVLIESEKATVELPAPFDGVLLKILKPRGAVAAVGEVIGTLEEGQASAAAASAPAETTPQAAGAAPQPATPPAPAPVAVPSPSAAAPAAKGAVMPAAQRILAEAGVSPETVPGSGPGGRVTKEDALKASAASRAPAAVPAAPAVPPTPPASVTSAPVAPVGPVAALSGAGRPEETVPMSPLRRTVARRLVEAQASMAMLTTFNEIDMSAVMALRKQYQEAFTAKHGIKLGFMSFFVKAVIDALRITPQLNAEVRDNSIVYRHYYDIGVAIGGGKGLVVPVLRNAERLSFGEIEKAIADFGARAKDSKIKPEELSGGTFTITNGGIYGSLLSTPIINPPQSGILGMHAIQERPVVVDGQIVARPMMYVALTYDHRIVDGREAVTFLKRVKEVLETPARMLLEA
jgi:2-oxoglutarate dehydrogenase E2 component (dihydrolipoamide succinyltransferase)